MRLLDARTLKFEEFFSSQAPPYAILSHTWGKEEPSFQEMTDPSVVLKKGYLKIQKTCRLALDHGLNYAWVDTCCIDKLSSAELTESINSMYQWYQNAEVCFVWLEDLYGHTDVQSGVSKCRWLTRGWTLQELLAPKNIEFYDATWALRGSKRGLSDLLARTTRVPLEVLQGFVSVNEYSVAVKMSWAASRSTTRVEDIAYCLLGIFDVNMPLIYGEGQKAFRRLQEEIVKRSNDMTIFAWDNKRTKDSELLSIFAVSPTAFADCGDIDTHLNPLANFSISNKGLLMTGGLGSPPLECVREVGQQLSPTISYFLVLGTNNDLDRGGGVKRNVGIFLRKIGPTLFCRDSRYPLGGFGRANHIRLFAATDGPGYCILLDNVTAGIPRSIAGLCKGFRKYCVWVPSDSHSLMLRDVSPSDLWDWTDRVFLRTTQYPLNPQDQTIALTMVYTIRYDNQVFQAVAICSYNEHNNTAYPRLINERDFERGLDIILNERSQDRYILWSDFVKLVPEVMRYDNTIHRVQGSIVYSVSLSFGLKTTKSGEFEDQVPYREPQFHCEKFIQRSV